MGPISIQFITAIALASLYVGVSLSIGGIQPRSGIPWWFFAPAFVAFCGGFFAERLSAVLPVPWTLSERIDNPPRQVHLSWRAAVRIPFWAPVPIIPWHMFSILKMHFDLDWVAYIVSMLAVVALVIVALRRSREIRLLRGGETTMAVVRGLISSGEWEDRIVYEFTAVNGTVVSGTVWDAGYGVLEGSTVPVYYEAGNPRNHVVACACWFEAD